MTIQDIYQLAVKLGIAADPRGKAGVKKALERVKTQYQALPKNQADFFDSETLVNPYSDTRILFGDPTTPVDKVLVGIDIGSAEILLAERLNQKGESIDLVISHHPAGMSLAALHELIDLQIDMMANFGVPVTIAENLLKARMGEVERRFSPVNHNQAVDTARLLNLPFLSVHTPSDNLVYTFLSQLIDQKRPETVGEVVDMLLEIPEYQEAAKGKAGPTIQVGTRDGRAGRIVAAEITGGTEGAKDIYERLAHAGVGTIISMHASEEHYKETKKHHLNRVIAGHMSSDSLGMNLLIDKLEKQGVQALACSGFIRIRRH